MRPVFSAAAKNSSRCGPLCGAFIARRASSFWPEALLTFGGGHLRVAPLFLSIYLGKAPRFCQPHPRALFFEAKMGRGEFERELSRRVPIIPIASNMRKPEDKTAVTAGRAGARPRDQNMRPNSTNASYRREEKKLTYPNY